MRYLSTAEKVTETDLLALGTKHLDMGTPLESAEALRDRLIELVSVRNLKHRPEALFALFRQFLQRLTLPRLCHFLDLVLPQLTPVRAHGPMLLGRYGPATILEPSLTKMGILIGRRLPLHTSSRRMTIFIMCESTGVHCRSFCFLILEWCLLWMCISSKAKLCID